MKKMLIFLVFSLVLSACGSAGANAPDMDAPVSNDQDTPAPSDPPYAIKADDVNLTKGNVFIDRTDLVIRESYPPQIALMLEGGLPTPCHELRVVAAQPDAENRIMIEAYSVVDPNKICVQVIEAFSQTVELGTFASGHYTVFLNGEQIGEFDS
jgi:hypothetical protein